MHRPPDERVHKMTAKFDIGDWVVNVNSKANAIVVDAFTYEGRNAIEVKYNDCDETFTGYEDQFVWLYDLPSRPTLAASALAEITSQVTILTDMAATGILDTYSYNSVRDSLRYARRAVHDRATCMDRNRPERPADYLD